MTTHEAPQCPACDKPMRMKDGVHGPFWACCDYTKSALPCDRFSTPADRRTRMARSKAWTEIKRLYQGRGFTKDQQADLRVAIHAWIARYLAVELPLNIGAMGHAQCCQVLAAIEEAKEMEREAGVRA